MRGIPFEIRSINDESSPVLQEEVVADRASPPGLEILIEKRRSSPGQGLRLGIIGKLLQFHGGHRPVASKNLRRTLRRSDNVVLVHATSPEQVGIGYPNYSANVQQFLDELGRSGIRP